METQIQPHPPTLEPLLQSNEAPSQAVRLACRGELSAIHHRLAVINREILDIEQRAATLREEKSRLRSYIPTYQRILNPVRAVSDDVLNEIFMQASNDFRNAESYFMSPDTPGQFFETLDTAQPPWTLAQVCRSWRRVALNSPSLWSTLRIQMLTPSASAHQKRIMAHRLITFLSRSGNLTLNVELKSYYTISPDDVLLFTLCSHSSQRWRKLRLSFRLDEQLLGDVLHTVSVLVKSNVGLLQSLFLDMHGYVPDGHVFDAFAEAPNLQQVIVRGLSHDLHAILQIPWAQITHFRRLKGPPSRARPRSFPNNIEHLVRMSNIVEYHDAVFVCPPGPDIHLPHLRTFIIVVVARPTIALHRIIAGDLFTEFQVGNSELDVWMPHRPQNPHEQGAVMKFCRRWKGTLRSLSLCVWSIRSRDCVSFFRDLQHLESLSLFFGMWVPWNLVQALSEPEEITSFLPRLQCLLFFGWVGRDEFRPEHYIPMLEARSQNDRSLRTVGFPDEIFENFGSGILLTPEEIFGDFQTRGLSIKPVVPDNWSTGSLPSKYHQHYS